ncbi:hypothetical protein MOF32_25180 [Priestia megaterium]|jgi:hypothetical protein|uniref:hypothetical protein n=1 Tax=Priestia megaterium TaxID=1404 RepID=UPI002280C0D7|nr:hypothetical protein [Priestia megaterium]MCY9018639.1 hypothetical protein [Priestia megaterium]MCY9026191.1 hypothetical protein [Priestia megaterium]
MNQSKVWRSGGSKNGIGSEKSRPKDEEWSKLEQIKIDELNIANVSHYKAVYINPGIAIEFSIDGFRYKLYTSKQEDGVVTPHHITHLEKNIDCNYCEKNSAFCLSLMEHSQELFHQLIEFPRTRLEWLYLTHA